MKIAIPTNDERTISSHFGRTKGFVICEVEENKIVKKDYKENNFTGHAQGKHQEHEHNHNQGEGNHSHEGIFGAIGDCKTVIAGGMGRRLYDDFEKRQINVFVTKEQNIDKAVELFLNDKLDNNTEGCCNH